MSFFSTAEVYYVRQGLSILEMGVENGMCAAGYVVWDNPRLLFE